MLVKQNGAREQRTKMDSLAWQPTIIISIELCGSHMVADC